MVAVIVREDEKVGRTDLLQFGLEELGATGRPAVHHHDAMMLPHVTLDDKGVAVIHW